MRSLADINGYFSQFIEDKNYNSTPENLYLPIDYMMHLGGKRIRPALLLFACEAYKGNIEDALPLAHAVEIFHNFTLVHDDIMDEAPLRRNQTTVHTKWDLNTGILSGDAMLILAYQALNKAKEEHQPALLRMFNDVALLVCDGQQLDIDFESEKEVPLQEYIEMIRLKTAVLLSASLKIGAFVADASKKEQEKIEQFGEDIGLAFQLRDDYLDVFGTSEEIGKQAAGDILTNKKTALFLYASEILKGEAKEQLMHYYSSKDFESGNKIEAVVTLFKSCGADKYIVGLMKDYYDKAIAMLESLEMEDFYKAEFRKLSEKVISRIN